MWDPPGVASRTIRRGDAGRELDIDVSMSDYVHMKTIKLTLKGTRPLLMHNPRLSDPLDPYTVAIKRVTDKRRKTDADHEEKANLEFEGGIYYDDDIGPYMPSTWLRGALIAAGKITRQGTAIQRAVIVVDPESPVIYHGPRELAKLKADANFRYRCTVRAPGRVPRTRPMFRDWQASFDVAYDETIINRDTLIEVAEQAGMLIGVGDGRSLGTFGRFTVEVEDQ